MKDNEMCDACRESLFRLAQNNHSSEKLRGIYLTLNRINADIKLLNNKLRDAAVEDLF
tara:strand:+ start:1737 stop:1910 length:174 start_codon:yes stop_codon:yes gene_type:complete